MATYVPNATDPTEPVESQTVESAALEFRTLKTSVPVQVAAALATAINTGTAGVAAEAALRIAADEFLQAQLTGITLGGAGSGSTGSFGFQHPHTINVDQAITVGNNAMSAGPITIADGVTITVPVGSTYTIV